MSNQDNSYDKDLPTIETLSNKPSISSETTLSLNNQKALAQDITKTNNISEAETLSLNNEAISAIEALAKEKSKQQVNGFPVNSLKNYEFIKFLGEGGMGKVYKARDIRLNRLVALKFIHGDNSEMIRRLVQEAQAQARIVHKNVCKVYEVNEVQGRPYIAMQFIDGTSLKEASSQLNLKQKIKIIIDVALALHEAHREGIIHRDIKPANIMLERSENGDWCPYLMDFGLARDVTSKGNTVTGAIMGTPTYMPPEQARGDRNLDHRTDIYSLGASLYELLCDQPPFTADSVMAVIVKVLNDEPIKLRKVNSTVPQDLETIVMKCLEKEVIHRYGSAKELAEDLQNFLDGEPISARRASLVYILSKKVRKHRALVTVSTIALLTIIGFAVVGIRARMQLAERGRIAQTFGEKVKEIEAISRYSKMLPVHNTLPEKKIILERMKEIQADMKTLGKISEGSGNYALGTAYISLNKYDKAKEHLEKAWNSGYQTPETAYGLGEVLSTFYYRKIDDVKNIPDPQLKNLRLKELDDAYKQPALKYFKIATATTSLPSAYIEAKLFIAQGQYEESIKKANEALVQSPWFYESKDLIALSYIEQGRKQSGEGNIVEAINSYEQANKVLQEAIDLARSNSHLYKIRAYIINSQILLKQALSQPINPLLEEMTVISEKTLIIDPEDPEAYGQMAVSCLLKSNFSKDPIEKGSLIKKALEMGEKAVSFADKESDNYLILARIQSVIATILLAQYESPIKFYDQALSNFQKTLDNSPNHWEASTHSAQLLWAKALYQLKVGVDVRDSLDRCVLIYEKLLKQAPNTQDFINLLGNAYETRAEYELTLGNDPRPWLELASSQYKKIPQDRADFPFSQINLGLANKTKGSYELMVGIDPLASFDKSVKLFEKGLELSPFSLGYCWLGETHIKAASYELGQGHDLKERLGLANLALEKSLQIDPSNYEAYLRQAQKELIAGRFELQQNRSPKTFFDKSKLFLEKSLQINPNFAETYQTYAELLRWQLEFQAKTDSFTSKEHQEGLKMVDKALSINPKLSSAFITKGYLYLLQAQAEKKLGKPFEETTKAAKAAFEEAISINALWKQEYLKITLP